MESSNTECLDIITKLARMQMYHVTDGIFKYLEFKALKNAELAVENWKAIIASGKSWEKFLQKKVFLSPDWANMLCVVKAVEPNLLLGSDVSPYDYRRACYLIAEKLMKQEHNWKHGITTKKKCSIRSAYSNTIAFDFNKQWALIGKGYKIIIRNRFSLEIVKELTIPIMQINVSMIQLQKNPPKISLVKSNDLFIVTCFHGYPEVCIWNTTSLDLLGVLDTELYDDPNLSDELMHWENYICLHGNSLLTIKWNGIEGGKICTMYRISQDPDVKTLIRFRETLLFQQEFVLLKDIVMDDTHILMLFILENDDGLEGEEEFFSRIEIRSASSFDVINAITLKTEVSHFHYLGGLICAGKLGRGWIKFWSTAGGQLEYRKKINHPYFLDGLKLINDKYLVTSDLTPYLRIWDLEKILNSDGLSGFLLYTIKPAQSFFRDGFDSFSMLADEFQIGLVAQFDRKTLILSVWDFIGDWDSPPSKKRKSQPIEDYDD